ncbi:MAG: hypothetical protein OXN97_01640 [Bryobacterales bacterium]|nr:hypothetical protein [Bryobacterales bacterium]
MIRLDLHRVELVDSTCEPNRAELEASIAVPQMSMEEAARRLMEPMENYYIDKPPCES